MDDITITLNGQPERVAAGISLISLLRTMELSPDVVSVGLNGGLVERERLDQALLNEGDAVEILLFMGGGC